MPKRDTFKSPTLQAIFNDVVNAFNQDAEIIKSKARAVPIRTVRYIYCYVARKLTACGYFEIGKIIGATEHTRVLHNIMRVKEFMDTGDSYFMEYWNHYITESKVWKDMSVKSCPCCGRPYQNKITATK